MPTIPVQSDTILLQNKHDDTWSNDKKNEIMRLDRFKAVEVMQWYL